MAFTFIVIFLNYITNSYKLLMLLEDKRWVFFFCPLCGNVWIELTSITTEPNAGQLLGGRVFIKYIKVNLSVSYVIPYSHLKLKKSLQRLFPFLCSGRLCYNNRQSLWRLSDKQPERELLEYQRTKRVKIYCIIT